MDTVDCWRIDGSASLAIGERRAVEKIFPAFSSNPRSVLMRIRNEITALIPCAISVAHAAPATPIEKDATMMMSRTTFSTDENIRRKRGIFDLPSALNIDESTLYMKRNGRPRK